MVPNADPSRVPVASLVADAESSARLFRLLRTADLRIKTALEHADELRLQILVTHFVPAAAAGKPASPDKPSLSLIPRTASFRASDEYLYPASTIKLLTATCALRALQNLQAAGAPVNARTPLRFHAAFGDQSIEDRDATNLGYEADDACAGCPSGDRPADATNLGYEADDAADSSGAFLPACPPGVICLEHEIRKSLVVSDNPAHNRLYTFVGHERVNTLCSELGLASTLINHRLSEFRSRDEQRHTGRVDFLEHPHTSRERVIATIPARTSDLILENPPTLRGLNIGRAHFLNDARIETPMDFSWRNRHTLEDMQRALVMLVRPELLSDPSGLTPRHRALICDALWPLPRQSVNPRFDPTDYSDASNKFVAAGRASAHLRARGRIFNKVGQAYGFTLDNAFLTTPNFFIAIGLYTNPGEVLGDDSYTYAPAVPLIARIAAAIAASPDFTTPA